MKAYTALLYNVFNIRIGLAISSLLVMGALAGAVTGL